MRFFNTTGPIKCQEHYCLPPLHRFDLEDIMLLIQQKKYFVLHAPRQVGKTSYLLALMEHLNNTQQYQCVYFNVEIAQTAREDVHAAIQAILSELASRARTSVQDTFVNSIWSDVLEQSGANAALGDVLTRWAEQCDKPLVLLIDEIDALIGDSLISVLRQLRAGYDKRPALFPQSIILCGLRDVRDYRFHTDKNKISISSGSPFNIKAESLRLGDFNQAEIETLYQQHTQETGQQFAPDVIPLVWDLTTGQPWLVNALAYEVCFKMKANRDRSKLISVDMIEQAKENLIKRRETHLDQLVQKLNDPRIKRVISSILVGDIEPEKLQNDDVEYVRDLGLISNTGHLKIANKIYQEIIPRTLTYSTQVLITHETSWYVAADGQLDINKLLTAFQQFFREHSEHWVGRFDYEEAGPQLLIQAFLQRVINSGGYLNREYGLGRGRTDLLVIWPHSNGIQRIVIELKIRYKNLQDTIDTGLEQTWQYMDKCGTPHGHLIIFDRTKNKPWQEKIFVREETYQGQQITVWGM